MDKEKTFIWFLCDQIDQWMLDKGLNQDRKDEMRGRLENLLIEGSILCDYDVLSCSCESHQRVLSKIRKNKKIK
jgi:hypothetical protein